MAGLTPIEITELPDFYQTISLVLTEQNIAAADNGAIFYAERDTVIESIHFTSPATDATNLTIDLKVCPSGTGPLAGGTDLITQITSLTAWTPVAATIDTTANIVPEGSFVAIVIADSTPTVDNLHIQMRIRTRIV